MAYCVQCGNQVGSTDRFCGKCGAAQAVGTGPAADPFAKFSHRDAATLCYIPWVGWVASIIVLATNRYRADHQTRFHAFQGLYLFVAWLLTDWVVGPMFAFSAPFSMRFVGSLLKLLLFCASIFMIVKVRNGEAYRLPVIGELADRSAREQHA